MMMMTMMVLVLMVMSMAIPVDDDVDGGGDGDGMVVMGVDWGGCDDMEVKVGGDAFLMLRVLVCGV